MSLEEKVYLMSGTISLQAMMKSLRTEGQHYNHIPYPAGGCARMGLSPVFFCDGPRGVVCGIGEATCFPVAMCRGATFDPELEIEIGKAIGREIRAFGGNLFGGVCINLPYNPGWGRSQEVYGEDSFALGKMGAALVRGVQSENVIATIKHFAFNSMEISRFKAAVDCERRTEREVYLSHFKDCIDAGAACVMSSYNLYKGIHCGHSDYLLRKVLKEEWDFDGFVMSDFIWGVKSTTEAVLGGQDMEMCCTHFFGDKLVQAVKNGLVSETRINEAALRIARTVLAFEEAYKASGKNYGKEVLGCKEHIALARRVAQEGITLLQNKNSVLPFSKDKVRKLALIGKLGNKDNIGDYGSSRVYPAWVTTPYQGFVKVSPSTEVIYYEGKNIEHAKKIAREADAVVLVLGFDHDDEGEYVAGDQADNYMESKGGDRKTLALHADEVELVKAVGPENNNSAVVLIGGNTITISGWQDSVSAILMAYYPGQEGGEAIAEILFGNINPSGKLPFVIPVKENDLPQVNWDTDNEYYHYYHGYAKLEKEGIKPLFPYGFGLSYTTFALSNPEFRIDGKTVMARCVVTNTGNCAGTEVVQMYVGFKNSTVDRPVKLLRGFKRVTIDPGASDTVGISCPVEKLRFYNPQTAVFEIEHMDYEVYIGSSSADGDLFSGSVNL